ncbi:MULTISPECIES: hypothetical protein [unclassified Cryobacterium]|uniref:hypothetical protein n=1 Tax=unclassified Cryobacterium TaxID=2649013 RepID=UPI001124D045|nr:MULTISPECIES: hypothetical protein [unclassified Cryobacterium]
MFSAVLARAVRAESLQVLELSRTPVDVINLSSRPAALPASAAVSDFDLSSDHRSKGAVQGAVSTDEQKCVLDLDRLSYVGIVDPAVPVHAAHVADMAGDLRTPRRADEGFNVIWHWLQTIGAVIIEEVPVAREGDGEGRLARAAIL